MFGSEVSSGQREIDSVKFWWHSIDVVDGIRTNGKVPADYLVRELRKMQLPDLHEKTVLDIGAWDGYFSFKAEELGAKRVLALDYLTWSMDLTKWSAGINHEVTNYETVNGVWKPGSLPGKAGFDIVHRLKNSKVESMVADFMEVDLLKIGQFDIVFFLGVLYHLKEPLTALRRLAQITKEFSIIETASIHVLGCDKPLLEFYEKDELSDDVTNWFAPNWQALEKMCRAAGFSQVELLAKNKDESAFSRGRIMARAIK